MISDAVSLGMLCLAQEFSFDAKSIHSVAQSHWLYFIVQAS